MALCMLSGNNCKSETECVSILHGIHPSKSKYIFVHVGTDDNKSSQPNDVMNITAFSAIDGLFKLKQKLDEANVLDVAIYVPEDKVIECTKIKQLLFIETFDVSVSKFPVDNMLQSWHSGKSYDDYKDAIEKYLQTIPSRGEINLLKSVNVPKEIFQHGFTKRFGGISVHPALSSLSITYSLKKPDSPLVAKENKRRLCDHLCIDPNKFNLAKVEHGNNIWIYEQEAPEKYDGIVTKTANVMIAAPGADCMMILLADPVAKACGAVHSGFAGVLCNAPAAAVNAMVTAYNSKPENIIAVIGACLGPCCADYTKGDTSGFSSIHKNVVTLKNEVPFINLRLSARLLLESVGVTNQNIDDYSFDICTKCGSNDEFFSHRRDGNHNSSFVFPNSSNFYVMDDIFKLLDELNIEAHAIQNCPGNQNSVDKIIQLVREIKERLAATKENPLLNKTQLIPFSQLDIIPNNQPDSQGGFGRVKYRRYLGQKVAVKFNDETRNSRDKFLDEIETLRTISHNNIIAFRGWGEEKSMLYLVMEHLDKNLLTYVKEHQSPENKGLTSLKTWDISNQLVQAMVYLHSRGIVHADLKPDNILIDPNPIVPRPKICDFGRAFREGYPLSESPRGHVRIRPPTCEQSESNTMEDFQKFDVIAFGLVVIFMRKGIGPYPEYGTAELKYKKDITVYSDIQTDNEGNLVIRGLHLSSLTTAFYYKLVKLCCGDAADRPLFSDIQRDYFSKDMKNPFDLSKYGEFFECGFLKNTYIYVADSLVGKYKDESGRPIGYQRKDLIFEVNESDVNNRPKPDDEILRKRYVDFRKRTKDQVRDKQINEHTSVALASLDLYRSRGDDKQRIDLRFRATMYSHHLSMRLVWRSMENDQKTSEVTVFDKVHPLFSTSFGLHVAVLTNEGERNTQKFVFSQRTRKPGRPSPGQYTCGAVKGCSALDYLKPDEVARTPGCEASKTYLSLVDAAARALDQELGLALEEEEKDAITLQTIYLKFDNHEWGMCGFVDLTNPKIREKNRYSFENLKTAFTIGPKDRYENQRILDVDFMINPMVEWIREHHDELASSTKIVSVSVMQAFFGITSVAKAFEEK